MPIDLTTLETLARAATPGPWHEIERCAHADDDEACGVTSDQLHPRALTPTRVRIFGSDAHDECSHPVSRANAAYIAALSPDVVLALVRVAREAQEVLNRGWNYEDSIDLDPLHRALLALGLTMGPVLGDALTGSAK
jgi:hypothetical protein